MMKTVEDAFFDPGGQYLITTTRGRFQCYEVDTSGAEPAVELLWEHRLSQVCWMAFGQDVVIASNTSDKHMAVAKKTGELLWERPRTRKDGISGHGIVVNHDGDECYVFAGYQSVFQASTETGADLCDPWPVEFWTAKLHDRGEGKVGVIVPAYVGANRDHSSLGVLDLHTQSLDIRCDLSPGARNPLPAPDGDRCLTSRYDPATGTTFEVLSAPSTTSLCSVDAPKGVRPSRSAWSPGGNWIGAGTSSGFFLSDSDLQRTIHVPYGSSFGTLTFHPDEAHVLLPRSKTTAVERIETLFDTYGE